MAGAYEQRWGGEMGIKLKTSKGTSEPGIISLSGPMAAWALGGTQIAKYGGESGHGFAAEDANHINDTLRLKHAVKVGADNVRNGPDRLVNGTYIQTKYCKTAYKTVDAAFDLNTGLYRYDGQVLEVPKDQYEQALVLMGNRIARRQVPGYSNSADAAKLVRRGAYTYRQARNIARAGNLDSLLFDAKSQTVTCLWVAGISFAISFARSKWSGRSNKEAAGEALKSAGVAGGTTVVAGVAAAQLIRVAQGERVAAILTKTPLLRLSGSSRMSPLFRTNTVTTSIAFGVQTSPDVYRAALDHSISWKQLTKNVSVNGAGIVSGAVGWKVGAVTGAAIGTAIPIPFVGTASGTLVGGLAGALGLGMGGSFVANKVVGSLIDHDANHLLFCLREEAATLASEYMLADDETEEITAVISDRVGDTWLRTLYKETRHSPNEDSIRAYIRAELEPEFEAVIRRRPCVKSVNQEIDEIVLRISDEQEPEKGVTIVQELAASEAEGR